MIGAYCCYLFVVSGRFELRDELGEVQHARKVQVLDERLQQFEHGSTAVLELSGRPHAVEVRIRETALNRNQIQNNLTLLDHLHVQVRSEQVPDDAILKEPIDELLRNSEAK